MILARAASVATMFVIAQFTSLWGRKWAILPLYCIRFGFMNCMYAAPAPPHAPDVWWHMTWAVRHS